MMRAAKNSFYCNYFNEVHEPGMIWRRLRFLGLIKQMASDKRLLFSVEEVNKFFLCQLLRQVTFTSVKRPMKIQNFIEMR